ncbi:MAG TPA: histidine kinase [Microlunatus sp.]|nr:histidine kinase [Microlunatus sp.]
MSRFASRAGSEATTLPDRAAGARTPGRSLVLRFVWVVAAVLTVGLFVAGVPAELAVLQVACPTPVCATGQLPVDGLKALTDLGLSATFYARFATLMDVVFAVGYGGIAALIFARRPDDRMAVFASLALLIFGTATFGFTLPALAASHPGLAAPVGWLGFLGAACFGLFLYVFPDGRFVPRWTGWVAAVWIGWQLAEHVVPAWTTNPGTWQLVVESVVWLGALGTVVYAQLHRYRHTATPRQRRQIRWVVFGITVAFAGFIGLDTVLTAVGASPAPTTPAEVLAYMVGYTTASYLVMLLVPVTLGVALLRHHLFEVDVVISRSLIFGGLTACVVGLYVLVVAGVGLVLQPTGGGLAVPLLATGMVALVLAPLHGRLQRGVNRLIYGDRDEPYALVARLGQRLEDTVTPDAVLQTAVRTVSEALKLPYAAVELHRADGLPINVVEVGEPVPSPVRLPLRYAGETLGLLALAPRVGEDSFSARELRRLGELARQIGAALHTVRQWEQARRLSADLQRSRQRLVTTREDERSRLRRDLHDGVGPQLAAMMMTAETARDLIATDPRQARELLDGLISQARETVAEVRRVVYGLRPPALDALGLGAALRMLAHQHPQLQLDVCTPDLLPALPAAVEVAVYRIAAEALSNVATHAGTTTARLTLQVDDASESVRLEVSDSGSGLAENRGAGVGLTSMRERAAELGGTLTVAAGVPHGTVITAELPYRSLDRASSPER